MLRAAFDEALARGAKLRVRYAWKPAMYSYAGVADWNDAMSDVAAEAQQKIASVMNGLAEQFPAVYTADDFSS